MISLLKKNMFAVVFGVVPVIGYSLIYLYYLGKFNYYGLPLSLGSMDILRMLPFTPLLIPLYYIIIGILTVSAYYGYKLLCTQDIKLKILGICLYYTLRFVFPLYLITIFTWKFFEGGKEAILFFIIYICFFAILGKIEWQLLWSNKEKFDTNQYFKAFQDLGEHNMLYHFHTIVVWYVVLAWCTFIWGNVNAMGEKYYISPDGGKTLIISMKENYVIAVDSADLGKQKFTRLRPDQYATYEWITLKR